ncbi:MAG: DUF3794 domain-containing protein [Clostridia bacterium]|nr:DUF3794 domain-containing protein [Clostridia bacterium]
MDLKIIRQGIEVEKLVGERQVQLPVRAEALVPGAGRESVSVLMADGFAAVTGSEAQAGRVVVSGDVFCQAAYRLGQEGGARALTAQAPFEQMVEIEGVTPKMSVQTDQTVDHVEAAYESGHMVFYVTVTIRVRVCSLDTVEAVSDIEGIGGVQKQTREICSAKLNAETSDSVELKDEVSLPAALNARVTLMQWAQPTVERAERDLGGVRVSGEVKAEALIASGVLTRPVALVRYALPFEKLISLPDWIAGEPEASAEVSRLRVTVDEGGEGEESRLEIQCSLLLTVRMNGQDCVTVMTDVYSTGDVALEGETELLRLCAGEKRCTGQETIKNTLLLPEGAPAVGTVLAVRVHPAVSGWREESGRALAEGVLEASILYMQAGEEVLSSARAELPFSMQLSCLPGEGAWIKVAASDAEATALMSDRLELRCLIRAQTAERLVTEAAVLTSVQAHEAQTLPAGIGICYPQKGDTLWSIGRKYRISEEEIRAANAGIAQAEAGKPLLILRGRKIMNQ